MYLIEVRDHRGLRGAEAVEWEQARRRLQAQVNLNKTLGVLMSRFLAGELPFAVFLNVVDGARWGRFFNPKTNTITTRPAPAGKSVLDYAKDLGSAIVGGLEWLALKAAEACRWFNARTDGTTERAAAEALSKGLGLPPGSIETARRVCQLVTAAGIAIEGAPPAPVDNVAPAPRYSLGPLTTQAAPMRTTPRDIYPEGAVALRSPGSGGYVILVMKG